jgi:hypothetical protein
MTSQRLLEEFWEWRQRGRHFQTLQEDLELFLTPWQYRAGWQVCGAVYGEAMERLEWDISQGGRRPEPLRPRLPERKRRTVPQPPVFVGKKGGLIARL